MKKLFSINKNKMDFEGALGRLEKDIMDVLWDKGGLSGREVFLHLKSSRDIALTTVLTVIDRLVKKGIVMKTKGESTYIYAPANSKEEFTRNLSRDVFRRVMQMNCSDAVASFVDIVANTDPKELDRLKKLVEAKKKELGKR